MALQTLAPRVPVGTVSRLEFQLNNRNDQPVLFMNDTAQALVLVVQNTGTQELSLFSRGKQPASIELRFRPGSLALKDPVTLLPPESAAGTAGWTLTQRTEEDGTLTLALHGPAAGGTLKPGQLLRFVLDKILADARAGSRAIRTQLRWWLSTLGGSAVEGSRQHHLSVLYLDQSTLDSRFKSDQEQFKKDQNTLAQQLKQQQAGPVDTQKLLADVTALQKLVTELQKEVSDLKRMPAGSENPLPLRVFVDGDAAVLVSGYMGTKSVTSLKIKLKNVEPLGGKTIKASRDAKITFDFGKDQFWGLYGSSDSPAFNASWTADTPIEADGKLGWKLAGAEIAPQNVLILSIANLSSTLPPGTAHVLVTYEGLELDGQPCRSTVSIPIERRNDYHAHPTQTIINGDVHVRNSGKLIFRKSAYAPDNNDPNQADILLDGDQLVLKAPGGIRLESDAGSVAIANDEVWVKHRDGHELKLTKDWGQLRHSSGRKVFVNNDFVHLWHSDFNEIYVRNDQLEARNKSGQMLKLDGSYAILSHSAGHELNLTKDWGHLRHNSGRKVFVDNDSVCLWHSDYNEVFVRNDLLEAHNKSGQMLNLNSSDATLSHSKGHTLRLTPEWCHLRHTSGRELTVTDSYTRLIQSTGHEITTHIEGLRLAYKGERAFQFVTRELSGWSTDLGYSADDWVVCIVGFKTTAGDVDEFSQGNPPIVCWPEVRDGRWWINADFVTHMVNESWTVQLLLIRRSLVAM